MASHYERAKFDGTVIAKEFQEKALITLSHEKILSSKYTWLPIHCDNHSSTGSLSLCFRLCLLFIIMFLYNHFCFFPVLRLAWRPTIVNRQPIISNLCELRLYMKMSVGFNIEKTGHSPEYRQSTP